jgi:hypothetical protein
VSGPGLSADQAAAVRGVLASSGDVNVIVGPAGTGKTTTMGVVSAAWQANGGIVVGLAVTQTAANELAQATGGNAEKIAKLLYETRRINRSAFPVHAARWGITAGQLVIMDEAGLTDRAAMVQVSLLCEQAGAKLVLVGDHEQLESPEACGAMRLMAQTAGAFELGQVHRFVHVWERDASLRLRAGDVGVLDEYAEHGRIYGGTPEANERRAVRFALADHLSGRRVFVLAGTNERAAGVAGAFRDGLVAHGRVEADGVRLHDGNRAGVGDRIVARENDRSMTTTGGGWVTNRSVYEVVARDRSGGLTVAVVDPETGRADRADWVTLPAGYVGVNVELEYAGTVHAAQGGTRLASQALVGERDTANGLYVALTRGRESNVAHVDSETEAAHDRKPTVENPVAVLARVVGREDSAEAVSALEAYDLAVTKAKSLRTLFPIWQDLEAEHAKARWQARLSAALGDNVALSVTGSAAWPTLVARLATIEAAGGDPAAVLEAAIASRSLGDAGDVAAVLHYRLELEASTAERACSLHAPFSLRDIGASRYTAALLRVGARMDQQIVELGEQALEDPLVWGGTARPGARGHGGPDGVGGAGRDGGVVPRGVYRRGIRPYRGDTPACSAGGPSVVDGGQ